MNQGRSTFRSAHQNLRENDVSVWRAASRMHCYLQPVSSQPLFLLVLCFFPDRWIKPPSWCLLFWWIGKLSSHIQSPACCEASCPWNSFLLGSSQLIKILSVLEDPAQCHLVPKPWLEPDQHGSLPYCYSSTALATVSHDDGSPTKLPTGRWPLGSIVSILNPHRSHRASLSEACWAYFLLLLLSTCRVLWVWSLHWISAR